MLRINLDRLIVEVQNRPCLWNTKDIDYKDKFKRDLAWIEIAIALVPGFVDKTGEKRAQILRHVSNKWRVLRDGYGRFLKIDDIMPSNKVKPYAYADSMTFLQDTMRSLRYKNEYYETSKASGKTNANDEESEVVYIATSECDFEPEMIDEGSDEQTANESQTFVSSSFENNKMPKKRKISHKNGDDDDGDADGDDVGSATTQSSKRNSFAIQEQDEDMAFFHSLLPTVKTLDVNNKFKFRIQVMHLLNHLRQQTNATA